ncbi:hypothetical protein RD792_013960 [Penstemon davidsonii]|uniref:Poly(A) polymerase RNA-binding domain-containing protein n=1 Tax=Penstemon davidsonii TaxID=160366 RepID=A0ABR0CNW1_9LAMI|nr:hypothetical protein RD792_013960 [Penstemon davidsonii]
MVNFILVTCSTKKFLRACNFCFAPPCLFLVSYSYVLLLLTWWQAIEANKVSWDALFEPFAFFEAYKNYLQIDIAAETDDDLMNWKGWVESRIRLLTLKIERDTNGVLQCHPYPGEFSDISKPFHHSYFMGLRRKQGTNPQEGEQFDIRMTVEDFKRDVYAYSFWKPAMWIHVCHVKRKDIPNFVFPGGVRPNYVSRSAAESRSVQKSLRSNSPQADAAMIRKRRKQDEHSRGVSLTESSSTAMCSSDATSFEETMARKQSEHGLGGTISNVKYPKDLPNHGPEIPGLSPASGASSGSLAMEKPVIELSSPILGHLSALEIPDGMSETLDNGDSKIIKPLESSTEEEKAPEAATVGNGADSCSKIQPYRDLEELEPLELPVTTSVPSNSANVQTQKPVIRFSFTSLAKATGNSA